MVKIIEIDAGIVCEVKMGSRAQEDSLVHPPVREGKNLCDYLSANNLQHVATESLKVTSTIDRPLVKHELRQQLDQSAKKYGTTEVLLSENYFRIRSIEVGENDHYLAQFYGLKNA